VLLPKHLPIWTLPGGQPGHTVVPCFSIYGKTQTDTQVHIRHVEFLHIPLCVTQQLWVLDCHFLTLTSIRSRVGPKDLCLQTDFQMWPLCTEQQGAGRHRPPSGHERPGVEGTKAGCYISVLLRCKPSSGVTLGGHAFPLTRQSMDTSCFVSRLSGPCCHYSILPLSHKSVDKWVWLCSNKTL
jgi:hypothetical protein